MHVIEYFESTLEFTRIEFPINLCGEQGRLGPSQRTLTLAVVVDFANQDSLMVGTKDLNLLEVEGREESALDLFAQSVEVVTVGFCQEEN